MGKNAGKGGMQIVQTYNKKFLLKEVTYIEKHVLISFIGKYLEHLKKNPKSLIAKIFGLFSLKLDKIKKAYFIIMQNLD